MDRERAGKLGEETLQILRDGAYSAPSGKRVSIAERLARAQIETVGYSPEDEVILTAVPRAQTTQVEVRNESTLAAARAWAEAGGRPCALNFASATHPGGGFEKGALAQEESLARASGLHACIAGHPMYAFHRKAGDPIYTSWLIYSPDVPVFRDDDGALLEAPYGCAFLTAAAPNAKLALERNPSAGPAIHAAFVDRVDRVLAVAHRQGHADLVLGAWGCGVFGNDPAQVAEVFGRALHGSFAGVFRRVRFAILDRSPEGKTIGPFQRLAT
jgi:uncharacterized protein (TIGR02452 family)